MLLGCHVGMKAPKYLVGSVEEALSYGANALMVYTGAPQNTRRSPIEKLQVEKAQALMMEHGIPMERMIVHAPYLINLANAAKKEVSDLATSFLESEVQRTHEIGAKYIVVHPGSFTTTDLDTGLNQVIAQLNSLKDIPDGIMILLETMAGKGSEVGYDFAQLAYIIDHLDLKEHFGVCLDTCHINDAGYDLNDFDVILDEFDQTVGLDRLRVVHLNDSKNEKGARKDRHANIGLGTIGFEALYNVASNPRIEHVVKILETPYINKKAPYAIEIDMLQNKQFDSSRLLALEQ